MFKKMTFPYLAILAAAFGSTQVALGAPRDVTSAITATSNTLKQVTSALRAMNAAHSSTDMLVARLRVCRVFNKKGSARELFLSSTDGPSPSVLETQMSTLRAGYRARNREGALDGLNDALKAASDQIVIIDDFCNGRISAFTHAQLDETIDEAAFQGSIASEELDKLFLAEFSYFERFPEEKRSEKIEEKREGKSLTRTLVENAGRLVTPLIVTAPR